MNIVKYFHCECFCVSGIKVMTACGLCDQFKSSTIFSRMIMLLLRVQSFLTLSLDNVASHIRLSGGAKEAEKYIRTMVGDCHCVISVCRCGDDL